jgi:hypothetical protein
MPASLRPSSSTSFGHLKRSSFAGLSIPATASRTASAAAKLKFAAASGQHPGRNRSEQ